MQAKPSTSTGATKRDSRVSGSVRAGSPETDQERADWEGMGWNSQPAMSPDAERHLARYGALSRRVMSFDLNAESKQLILAPGALHTARTIAKLDAIRLTLMKLQSGATVREHQAAHQVSIHTLSGLVVLHIEGQPVSLSPGHVVVLARGVAHDIVAKEDSVVLITVSAPEAV